MITLLITSRSLSFNISIPLSCPFCLSTHQAIKYLMSCQEMLLSPVFVLLLHSFLAHSHQTTICLCVWTSISFPPPHSPLIHLFTHLKSITANATGFSWYSHVLWPQFTTDPFKRAPALLLGDQGLSDDEEGDDMLLPRRCCDAWLLSNQSSLSRGINTANKSNTTTASFCPCVIEKKD